MCVMCWKLYNNVVKLFTLTVLCIAPEYLFLHVYYCVYENVSK